MDAHHHDFAEVPEAARVITMALSMITISVLAICLSTTIHKNQIWTMSDHSARRIQIVQSWKSITLTNACKINIVLRF